jgi:hypothetical protein
MDISAVVREAAEQGLSREQVEALCSESGFQWAQFLDEFSRFVAHAFAEGLLSYELADAAVNGLYAAAVEDMTEYTWSVYLAFDAGEYYHPGDSREVDPVAEYTWPAIREIVGRDPAV